MIKHITKGTHADAIAFVATECARVTAMTLQALDENRARDLPRRDMFATLPHPEGQGEIMCGRDAYEQLRSMATVALDQSAFARTALIDDVFKSFRRLVSERFLTGVVAVSDESVALALSDSVEVAAKKCANSTHVFPCRLMHVKDPDEFVVGPVTFRTQAAFDRAMAQKFDAYIDRNESETAQARDRMFLANARAYYETFGWAAEVKVFGCAPEISHRRAQSAVRAAVNILSLVLGGYHTRKMAVGGFMLPEDRRAHMSFDENGQLSLSTSSGATSAVGFEKGWGEVLKREDVVFLLEGAEQALASTVDPALSHPLSERFVEALSWFGEALREETPGSSIVKAVTAMERLVMTGKPRKPNGDRDPSIKLVIAHRAAMMQWKTVDDLAFAPLVGKMARYYELRSRLTHGEVSPHDTDIALAAPSCLKFVEETLRAGLFLFRAYNILPRAMTAGELGEGFDLLVQEAIQSDKRATRKAA